MNIKDFDARIDCASEVARTGIQADVESVSLALDGRDGSEAIARMVKSQLERFLSSDDEESLPLQAGAQIPERN